MDDHKNLPLPELVEKLMVHLDERGYAESTRCRLRAYYAVFIKYAKKHGIHSFTLEIGKTFLSEHHGHEWTDTEKLSIAQNYLQKHILMLHEFQMCGEVITRRRSNRIYALAYFSDVINSYIDYEQHRNLKAVTLKTKHHMLNQIFEYFESLGLKNTRNIKATHIFGFLESRTYFSVTTKEAYQYLIRNLIRYLYDNDACCAELTQLFPVISIHTKNAYPSHFNSNDITRVLQCVDTATKMGKRDYFVLLLAAELGMRVSDICALKIESIDAQKKCIEYVQQKTGATVTLPISDELLCAFADYMKNVRPKCSFGEVLISHRAPIRPFHGKTFHAMLQKYLCDANVKVAKGQKHGMHSLRSSLASNMLGDGVSVLVISNILGHNYVDTSRSYIKIDLDGLRKCVLEVPAV